MSNPELEPVSPSELRTLAEEAVRIGGAVARSAFGGSFGIRLKADRSEVTDADLAAEGAVVGFLSGKRPDDGFVTEENPRSDSASGIYWIVDPIDGTRNFVRGIPCFACTVAAMQGGVPVAGAIYDPMNDVLYAADRDEGAFQAGAPLRIEPRAGRPQGGNPKLLVGIPSTRHARSHKLVLRWLDELVVRNFGAATIHLAMVASGRLDATLLTNSRLWDIAAGWLLVKHAGGEVTTPEGAAIFPIETGRYEGAEMPALAASRSVHAQLVSRE